MYETYIEKSDLEQSAISLRQKILESLYAAGGGHYGGALSVADILLVLYSKVIRTKTHQHDNNHDRLILSKGHAAIALYCLLAQLNHLAADKLPLYGKFNSGLEGHPDMLATPQIDFSSGSLGQGLSVGLGMAMGLKNSNTHVWVILGDGECQEGQIWEAALLAARYKVSNLHVVIDANGAQECGYKHDPSLAQEPIPQLIAKWQAFGWLVQTVDGHDHIAMEYMFKQMLNNSRLPSVTIARTKKGQGISMFEQNPEKFHCTSLTQYQHKLVLQELQKCSKN